MAKDAYMNEMIQSPQLFDDTAVLLHLFYGLSPESFG